MLKKSVWFLSTTMLPWSELCDCETWNVYREQLVHVDDHKREAVEGGFLLNQFSLVRQTATGGAGVLPVTAGTRPPQRRRRGPVARRRRRGRPATQAVDVEQRRSKTDGQVTSRHLRHAQPLFNTDISH